MAIELVIFDMDGVIFEGRNCWLDLHRRYSTEGKALRLAERYLVQDYDRLGRVTAGVLWKGKPAAPFIDLVRERRYEDGVFELFAELRRNGVRTAIVSSGPLQLAARAQAELGIDEIRANELGVVRGKISGRVNIEVRDSDKERVSLKLMTLLGVSPDRTASVGDADSDVGVARVVGLPVAYDSVSTALDEVARAHLHKGELLELLEILRQV